jgi:hypothetical protein
MAILEVLMKWAFWLLDAVGVNLILKKIAQAFDKNQGSPKDDKNNLFMSRQRPQA